MLAGLYARCSHEMDDKEDFVDDFWVLLRGFQLEKNRPGYLCPCSYSQWDKQLGGKQLDRMLYLFIDVQIHEKQHC